MNARHCGPPLVSGVRGHTRLCAEPGDPKSSPLGGPCEDRPSPGAAKFPRALITVTFFLPDRRHPVLGGTEKTGERAVGCAQRRAPGMRGPAELPPRREASERRASRPTGSCSPPPLGTALAAHVVQPPAPTSLLPTPDLEPAGG